MNIEEKLDQLAEFYSQKDALELRKRELLNEIQVPAEIEQIVKNGMAMIAEIDKNLNAATSAASRITDELLAEVVIPQEYKDALAKLDQQRTEIMAKMQDVEKEKHAIKDNQAEQQARMFENSLRLKNATQLQIEAQTRDVFDQINQRKQEIEIEFNGKADDAQANIEKLEAEIKAEVKKQAAEKLATNPKSKDLSVKGQFFHAVYVKARKTWIPVKLDDYVETHPDIKNCYTEGEPSITLRRI